MKIIRIEHEITSAGMWYSEKGQYAPVILTIPKAKSQSLPMPVDLERYNQNNKNWICGCYSFELLEEWFSKADRSELYARGYALFGIETEEFIIEENQVIFTPTGIKKKWLIEK